MVFISLYSFIISLLLLFWNFHLVISLQVGCSKVDITGPAAELGISDFTQIGHSLSGIQQKQYARAYVLKEKDEVSIFVKIYFLTS